MAPSLDIANQENFEKLIKVADAIGIPYTILSRKSIKSNYLEIESIGLAVPKENILYGKNFYETQETLHKDKTKILTPYEFREFLKEAKEKDTELYNSITQVKSPWRAEWIDAKFDQKGNDWFVTYNAFDEKGNISEKQEKLDKETLMQDKTPGISIDSWLNDSTKQGLPKKSIKSGDLYYWNPRDGAVARFLAGENGASLDCYVSPLYAGSNRGVRAAKQLK